MTNGFEISLKVLVYTGLGPYSFFFYFFSGGGETNKHKQLFGIVPVGGGQICLCVCLFFA